jgi:guanylate kinase
MWVSGAGKNTILHLLSKNDPEYKEVISYKTRLLRPWETHWLDFHSMTRESFEQDIKAWLFLEHAQVYGWSDYYGTKRSDIIDGLLQWRILIKEIDMQWIQQIAANDHLFYTQSLRIFLDLPEEVMIRRITSRAPISDEELHRRLSTAVEERRLAKQFATKIISAAWSIEEVYNAVNQYIISFLDDRKFAPPYDL